MVIAGYQGVSYRREVTTLGRGGSDTTAVAMAAALGAEYCEICSDVDGVYTADPRVVPAARRIGTLTYEETQELAESGAKVLNAQAVEFAKETGIAIYARATTSPLPGADPSADGTVVRRYPPRLPATVVGVASERDVLVLEATGPANKLLALLDSYGVSGKQLHQIDDRLTLVISRENLHDEPRVREALAGQSDNRVRVVDDLGALSVVGAGINASFSNLRRGSEALTARHSAARACHFLVPHHVDGRSRTPDRGSPHPAPRVHRTTRAAGALKGPNLEWRRPARRQNHERRSRAFPAIREIRHAIRRELSDLSKHRHPACLPPRPGGGVVCPGPDRRESRRARLPDGHDSGHDAKPDVPTIGFIAHVDTSPEMSGANVKPIVHRGYDGRDLVLPDDTSGAAAVREPGAGRADGPRHRDRLGDDASGPTTKLASPRS